ncbi:hypothetical protein SY111_17290 [Ligilactobacillus agilis]|uniref:Uncharacterized protein n=1 Tax=Ligilactobacillus agilis TaxID=1601 RepID=A0A6F9XVB2_9LACO|nr:hypothetical protein SY111_17290 [Ligilactobacillus agilis]
MGKKVARYKRLLAGGLKFAIIYCERERKSKGELFYEKAGNLSSNYGTTNTRVSGLF